MTKSETMMNTLSWSFNITSKYYIEKLASDGFNLVAYKTFEKRCKEQYHRYYQIFKQEA